MHCIFGGWAKKHHNGLELRLFMLQSTMSILAPLTKILPKSYQNLTFLSPILSYTSLTAISTGSLWEAYTHRGAVGGRRFGWAVSYRNGRAPVLCSGAASGMSIESSAVLPILGRNSQGASRTLAGQNFERSYRHSLRAYWTRCMLDHKRQPRERRRTSCTDKGQLPSIPTFPYRDFGTYGCKFPDNIP